MKQVNNEYEQVFEYIKNNPITEQEKKSYYYANVNDGYREQIEKIVFIPDLQIEICGSWIWLNGNTYAVKNIIKDAGFLWAGNKKAWYWKPYEQKGYKHKAWDMDKIRNTYGSQKDKILETMQEVVSIILHSIENFILRKEAINNVKIKTSIHIPERFSNCNCLNYVPDSYYYCS